MPTITITPTTVNAAARTVTIVIALDNSTHVLSDMPVENAQACLVKAQQYLQDYYRGLQTKPTAVPVVDPALTAALNRAIVVTF